MEPLAAALAEFDEKTFVSVSLFRQDEPQFRIELTSPAAPRRMVIAEFDAGWAPRFAGGGLGLMFGREEKVSAVRLTAVQYIVLFIFLLLAYGLWRLPGMWRGEIAHLWWQKTLRQ